MIVIADATPLNYLILIDQAELLPRLFDRILIPPAVFEELQHQETPDVVRRWIARPPSWLHVQALRSVLDPALGLIQESGKPSPSRRSFTPISFSWTMPTLAAKRLGAACLSSGHWASCAKRHAAISSICETLWFNCRRPASLSIPR
jgi:hypothetical protein